MDILGKASELFEQGKAALDANGDGKVNVDEVIDALGNRAKETVDAGAEAISEVKDGFDADGDGSVSLDEVKLVGKAVAQKAKKAVDDLVDGDEEEAEPAPEAEAVAEVVAEPEPVAEVEPEVEAEVDTEPAAE